MTYILLIGLLFLFYLILCLPNKMERLICLKILVNVFIAFCTIYFNVALVEVVGFICLMVLGIGVFILIRTRNYEFD